MIEQCRLLAAIGEELEQTRPFGGLTIGTGIHLEPKTVALLLTLLRGGAKLVSTGNLNTTQQEAVDYLAARGVRVVGRPTQDAAEHDGYLWEVVRSRPQLLLDNGGDLFARFVEEPYDGLLGGTEETTSGRMRLEPLRDAIGVPVLVINDSPIKQFAENHHAVGQSVLESFMRLTNKSTNGRRVTVFGYGACGKGVAANFRNAYAIVSVVETDPVARLEAMLDGFLVPEREEALRSADVVLTVTGARDVVTAADLPLLRDGAILANAGHFPWEIDAAALTAAAAESGEADPRPHGRAHGQPRRAAAARQLDRVDGSRLRPPDALPRGGRARRGRARVVCRAGAARDRRAGRGRLRRALEARIELTVSRARYRDPSSSGSRPHPGSR